MNDDALSEAVVGGNLELAELLVKNGAKVSDLDLPEVSERGDIEAVKFLLKHGVDIDTENSYGRTALHNAVDGGHLELVKFLLKQGASTNTVDRVFRITCTPLISALWKLRENRYDADAVKVYLEIIKELLKSGADPHMVVKDTDSDGLVFQHTAYELAHHIPEGNEEKVLRMFDKYSKKQSSKWSLFNFFRKKK